MHNRLKNAICRGTKSPFYSMPGSPQDIAEAILERFLLIHMLLFEGFMMGLLGLEPTKLHTHDGMEALEGHVKFLKNSLRIA